MQPLGIEDADSNGHKSNRESSKWASLDNEFKATLIEFYKRLNLAVTKFVKKYVLSSKYNKYLSERNLGQRHPKGKSKILQMVSNDKYKKCKYGTLGIYKIQKVTLCHY